MARTGKIPEAEWEIHKAEITNLYPSMTLEALKEHMDTQRGFRPSVKQYSTHLKDWDLKKYNTGETWRFVGHRVQKRKLEGKESDVYNHGQLISEKKVKKEVSRHMLPTLASANAQAPSPRTPEGILICSPIPYPSIMAIENSNLPFFHVCDQIEQKLELARMDAGQGVLTQLASCYDFNRGPSSNTSPLQLPNALERTDSFSIPYQVTVGHFSMVNLPQPRLSAIPRRTKSARFAMSLEKDVRPGSRKFLGDVAGYLEPRLIERHHGELAENMKGLLEFKSVRSFSQLLRFFIYLSSNNMMGNDQIDKIFGWVVRSGNRWAVCAVADLGTASTKTFINHLLFSAIRLGDMESLRILIKKGADVNALAGRWPQKRPLEEAVPRGDLKMVEMLLDAGADVHTPTHNDYDRNILQQAIWVANDEIIWVLLEAGADVNGAGIKMETPLQLAAEKRNVELVKILLKRNANARAITHTDSCTALQAAAAADHVEIVKVLLDAGADVTAPAGDEYILALESVEVEGDTRVAFKSPIQIAAKQNNTEMVQILLAAGADVNYFPHYHGTTPPEWIWLINEHKTALQAAVSHENAVLIRILLYANADVEARDSVYCADTALQLAASLGNIKIVQILLREGADANAPALGLYGRTAIQAAVGAEIKAGKVELIRLLIGHGGNINASAGDEHGMTALQEAASLGDTELVRALIDFGADVNAPAGRDHGRTALQAAAAGSETIDLLKYLLKLGAKVNAPAALHGYTALQAAVNNEARSDSLLMARTLLDAGANVNASGGSAGTALEIAVRWSSKEIVHMLILEGADPNAPPPLIGEGRKRSALEEAAYMGDLGMMDMLIHAGGNVNASAISTPGMALRAAAGSNSLIAFDRLLDLGADVNALDPDSGLTALEQAVEANNEAFVWHLTEKGASPSAKALEICSRRPNPLIVQVLLNARAKDRHFIERGATQAVKSAVESGSIEIVQMLLNAGADVNDQWDDERTALQRAVQKNNNDMVQLLMEAGADVNAPGFGSFGRTALQEAAENGNMHLVRLFLQKGADINAPASSCGGVTALQAAAIKGHANIALLLLKAGVNVNAPAANEKGRTALEGAAEHGRLDMVQLLLNYFREPNALSAQCERAAVFARQEGYSEIVNLLEDYKNDPL
ncbi:MAG: hypothetical protein M1819_002643 [Sarea resinae]|nr:MAG: hypothetical protein M1819_002643 [Sarea resinae]